MKSPLLIVLIGSSLLFTTGRCLSAIYELEISTANPESGMVHMILDKPLATETVLFTRQRENLLAITEPRCEETGKLLTRTIQTWTAPEGCSVITWMTGFKTVSSDLIDVSKQANLYYPGGWWLYTEWSGLLRLKSEDSGLSQFCTRYAGVRTCRKVPSLYQAPLFVLTGDMDREVILDDTTITFFTGNLPDNFNLEGLFVDFEVQLQYLRSLIPDEGIDKVSRIDVLLLGIDSRQRTLGGAAGSSAFLANIAVDNGTPTRLIRTYWVAGHELSHMLGLGADRGVLWANESLAQYYGNKSLRDNETASQLLEEMIHSDTTGMGLLEAHKRVTENNEGQYYGLFYSRGVAFWRDIDSLISRSTGHIRDLDDYLPALLNGEFAPDGSLPPEFIESLMKVVQPEDLEQILNQYL